MKRILFLLLICAISIQADVLYDVIEVGSYSINIDINGDGVVDSYYIHPDLRIYVMGSDAIPPDVYYIDFDQDGIVDLVDNTFFKKITPEFFIATFVEWDTSGIFIRENQIWLIMNDTISPTFVQDLRIR